MTGKRYYITTRDAWQRHAARFAHSHWMALGDAAPASPASAAPPGAGKRHQLVPVAICSQETRKPFVNGRFYLSPAFGRALERAREAEEGRVWPEEYPETEWQPGPPQNAGDTARSGAEPQQQGADDDGHWVTIHGRHVLIHETQDRHKSPDEPRNENERRLANIVYNETASLHPDSRATEGRAGSAEDLQSARVAVAEIANRAVRSGHPGRVAPSTLTPQAAGALAAGNPNVVAAYNASLAAARQALAGSNITGGATQYRFRPNGDISTPIEGRSPVTTHFGPFFDRRPGKAPKTIVVAQ